MRASVKTQTFTQSGVRGERLANISHDSGTESYKVKRVVMFGPNAPELGENVTLWSFSSKLIDLGELQMYIHLLLCLFPVVGLF